MVSKTVLWSAAISETRRNISLPDGFYECLWYGSYRFGLVHVHIELPVVLV